MDASPTILLQTIATALVAGVAAQVMAERLAIPSIVPCSWLERFSVPTRSVRA
jgi:hypothetical protein